MKRPPDILVFKCLKTSLKSIIRDPQELAIIEQTAIAMNRLVMYGYQFIRLLILSKHRDNLSMPIIDKEFIMAVLRCLGKKESTCGAKSKDTTLVNELIDFRDKQFVKTFAKYDPPCYSKCSQIIDAFGKEMATCYSNNIKLHWIKRLFKTIKLISSDKKQCKKYVDYVLSNKGNLSAEFTDFHRQLLLHLPATINTSIPYHLTTKSSDFLKSTIWLAERIENFNTERDPETTHECRLFQCLPLRTSLIPHCISLDTTSIIDLFVTKGKTKLKKNVIANAEPFWKKHFKIGKDPKHKGPKKDPAAKLKIKGYHFHHMIKTDGFTANILFSKRIPAILQPENANDEDDGFHVPKLNELLYPLNWDESTDEVLVGCDPGKHDLLYMTDGTNHLRYSTNQRWHEAYFTRSNEITLAERSKKSETHQSVVEIENTLSGFKTATVYPDLFKEYLVQRHSVDEQVQTFYNNILFRKFKWRRYVQTQQSEQKLVQKIKATYGANCIIGHGDWSRDTQQKWLKPTPNKGLLKVLNHNFETYMVNEYCTSKCCHNCGTETEKFLSRVRNGRESKVHGLLRCKNVNCSTMWNRDLNGALNMRWCLKNQVTWLPRPDPLTRQTEEDTDT